MKSTLRLVAGGGRSGGLPSFRIGAELGGDLSRKEWSRFAVRIGRLIL